jgi:hypothetical protein
MGCMHHSAIRSRVNGNIASDDDRDDEHEDDDDDGNDGGDGDDDDYDGDDDDDGEDGDGVRSRDRGMAVRAIFLRVMMSLSMVGCDP